MYSTQMTHSDKLKLLVVCSKNRMRSPTAENIYRGDTRVDVRSAGISQNAAHYISTKDIEWSDQILCMESDHKEYIQQTFQNIKLPPIQVLDIYDEYEYMNPELIKLLKSDIESILRK